MKTSPALTAILLLAAAILTPSILSAEEKAKAKAPVWRAEQALDMKFHLLDRRWKINSVLHTRRDLPAALKPGEPPPFSQQPERVQMPTVKTMPATVSAPLSTQTPQTKPKPTAGGPLHP